jgi:hypothetical protein
MLLRALANLPLAPEIPLIAVSSPSMLTFSPKAGSLLNWRIQANALIQNHSDCKIMETGL